VYDTNPEGTQWLAKCGGLGNRPLIDRARAVLADILTGNYLIGEGVNMERVSIREASLRLHIPQSAIRQCIQDGELKAYRQSCPDGRLAWVVELPEEGWTSTAMAIEMGRPFSPWWWADGDKAGNVHYVEVAVHFSMGRNIPQVPLWDNQRQCVVSRRTVTRGALPSVSNGSKRAGPYPYLTTTAILLVTGGLASRTPFFRITNLEAYSGWGPPVFLDIAKHRDEDGRVTFYTIVE
jgi:hypothetical protein